MKFLEIRDEKYERSWVVEARIRKFKMYLKGVSGETRMIRERQYSERIDSILQINERHNYSDSGSPVKNTKDKVNILKATRVKKIPVNNQTEQTLPPQQ